MWGAACVAATALDLTLWSGPCAQEATIQAFCLIPLIVLTGVFLSYVNNDLYRHATSLPWKSACDADARPRRGAKAAVACLTLPVAR